MVSSLVGVCSFTWTVCPYCLPPQHFWFWIGQLLYFLFGRHGSHPDEAFPRRAWEGDLSHLEKIQEIEERSRSWENTALSVPARSSNWSLSYEDSRTHQQVWWAGQVVKMNHVMFCLYSMFSKGIHRAACWIVLVCSPLPCSCDLSCGLLQRLTHPGFYSSWCPWSCWATGPWRWTWTQLSILLVGWLCLVLYVHAYLCAFAFQ